MKYFYIFLLLIGFYGFSQASFNEINTGLPALNFSTSSLADVDNDGDLDVYLSGLDAYGNAVGGLYIYNHGAYTLSTTSTLPIVYIGGSDWADIDNDGDMDIMIFGTDSSFAFDIAEIYQNNGDGTFTSLNVGIPAVEQGSTEFVDVNNDGFMDISISGIGSSSNITKIYLNDGDSTFTELTGHGIPGLNWGKLTWGDYNNDTYPDAFISGFDDNTGGTQTFYTKLFINNNGTSFTDSGLSFHSGWLGDIEWADYNNDGNIDIIVSGVGGTGDERFTLLYKNNGDGTFTELDPGFSPVSHSSLEWADFDGDNDLDLYLTGVTTTPGDGNNVAAVYRNDGNDVFTMNTTQIFNASYYGDADTGDINNDGKMDIISTGYDEIYVVKTTVYLNNTVIAGLSNNVLEGVSVYPNPVQNILHIDNQNDKNIFVELFSIDGKLILQTKLENNRLNISDVASGIYTLKITNSYKSVSKKIVIQ